ncbi:GNAT family N-acetyltransferase [Nocardia flavorosea]|uniref:GNAT family N-acetyltransferase n=1 Tax=Nocardia flavorosea TaxID=53429 RepID=A0A846YP81_9NOCA|nr:GNAT family N-acetyltransferase [Nocardia flavorosea]NKY60583.1 GNAT family N-acetyltransferase [Nocardia flavorosea]
MGTELDVRRAEKSDFDALLTALLVAAPDEAVTEWIMRGHPADQFLDVYLPELIERGLAEDELWVAGAAGEIWAVSLWQAMDSVERLHTEAAIARAHADRAPDFRPVQRSAYVTELLAREHPRRFPHRYLELIVTVPQYRGRGAGAAILGNRIRALAAAGIPAYLEASTERSSRLYARQGFVRIGETHTLPEDGPTLIPMWFEA